MTTLRASKGVDTIRVLHVDDDSSILEISKQILMDMGNFDIDHACCVDEAVKKMTVGHYDVVISDYEMPQKDGLQFLKEIREHNNITPFILFTGKGREEVAVKALNLGADGYFDKQGLPETVYGELSHGIQLSIGRKKAEEELKRSNAKLELMNDKLRVVGGLTRHDVGNKLTIIEAKEHLLRKRIGDKPELGKYLDDIESAIDDSNKLFEFSRLYEKVGAEKPANMDVFECFNVAAALFSNLSTIKIVNECQGLQVMADSLLRQLFYNFIGNSLKHGEKVTQIRLRYTKDGEGVKLFYEDNGVGVSEANKSKLFEVGFTTGEGSGLGLYLVKKMMDVYGWSITEEGEPGKGAQFTITIPKAKEAGKES